MESQINQNLNQELIIKKPGIIHYLLFAIALAVSGFFMGSVHNFYFSDTLATIAPVFFGLVLSLWFTYGNNVASRVWKKMVLVIVSWVAYFVASITASSIIERHIFRDDLIKPSYLEVFIIGSLLGTMLLSLGVHFFIKKLKVENFFSMLILGVFAGLVFNFFDSWDIGNIPVQISSSLSFIAWQLVMGFGFEFAVNGFFKKSSSQTRN